MKCLIVEGNPTTRRRYLEAMQNAGYECLEVSSVAKAAYLLKTHEFHLILLDLKVSDGFTLPLTDYLEIKNSNATVILVNGSAAFPNAEHTVLAPRIDYVVSKPVNIADLQALAEYCRKIPA